MLSKIRALLRGEKLVADSLWVLSGNVVRLGLQALFFVLLARTLSVEDYGAFAGVLALMMVIGPFAGWGSSSLAVKRITNCPDDLALHWGRSFSLTMVSGLCLVALSTLLVPLLLPAVSPRLVCSIAIAELIAIRTSEVAVFVLLALRKGRVAAQLNVAQVAVRVLALGVMILSQPERTAERWAAFYLGGCLVVGVASVWRVARQHGWPRFSLSSVRDDIKEGFPYCMGTAAQNASNDLDKVVLVRAGDMAATGAYAAAYRLIDVAFTPVRSMLWTAQSHFFEQGAKGVRVASTLGSKILRVGGAAGLLAAVGIWATSPLVAWAFGSEYAETANVLRWLALIPLLRTIHLVGAEVLTGSGFQKVRTLIYSGNAVVNAAVTYGLVMRYSWRGAAVASLLSESLLIVFVWNACWLLSRRERVTDAALA